MKTSIIVAVALSVLLMNVVNSQTCNGFCGGVNNCFCDYEC